MKPIQLIYQVKYRLIKPRYVALEAPAVDAPGLTTEPIAKYTCSDGEVFTFLNLSHGFAGWDFKENGMLWAYNQNYFDWINQEGYPKEEAVRWIDRFIGDIPGNRIGLDPYPIALRCINWIKFFCRYPDSATRPRLNSLYSQLRLLEKKLEYHLLGNHLLEDAYALYIGAVYFNDTPLLKKAEKLLLAQLEEQILPDGAHYEQSPMYHCILLDRLLDAINIRRTDSLTAYASSMLGHLESIIYQDSTIPMLNDSAEGVAPSPKQIFAYAKRLGLSWQAIPMKECGYRKVCQNRMEAFVDVGNIMASYQPGHSHADALNFELRIDGKPFIVDSGISTYDKNARRQYERSTSAHNCVVVDGKDSSEVYGGFRIGNRCVVTIREEHDNSICAEHNGFDKPCTRSIVMTENSFVVEDSYPGEAVSILHLPADADTKRLKVEGATRTETETGWYSKEYNHPEPCLTVKMHFKGTLKYVIK